MKETSIIISIFFLMIIYFFYSPKKYDKADAYNLSYRNEMIKLQRKYMEQITHDLGDFSDKSEINRPAGVFVIYYNDFTEYDINKFKTNAESYGWKEIPFPNDKNIIYASCNKDVAFNIYKDSKLKIATYWYKDNHYCNLNDKLGYQPKT
ncbi:hypothetical protein [Moraxella oblonga]|uniref:hypothetical protein n=1 Tax=Moraxella oblonga TaxID=200413 RepID=UPI000834F17E|nr:hypothetical protein [Moraxella oblonga]